MGGPNDNVVRADGGKPPLGAATHRSQASLLAAIRRGDPAAIRELFLTTSRPSSLVRDRVHILAA